jgi:hypothetical protein
VTRSSSRLNDRTSERSFALHFSLKIADRTGGLDATGTAPQDHLDRINATITDFALGDETRRFSQLCREFSLGQIRLPTP